ncbi:2-dehydro-3-deoxygalactonokinase [Limibaculum sp. FT325]|uniref:2-dehydro-3-deoxygalactonokinase n=1 Tax=Thermohalobaculum sediminis TaxID=2939436 RepID=UPI0020C03BB3|nr:2-dehydro-3-deoxygalactonokinase [Limibaculum sediminis]MCL5777825.1 2-dehydro-3-deoxygalactonokinase [Limibaculum sediminis]
MGALIGIDWGTTRLRGYLIDRAGGVVEAREAPHGLRALPPGGFPAALAALSAGWPERLPVLMAGMVGARTGWREASYLDGTAGGVTADDLARALAPVDAPGRLLIVPGVRIDRDGTPDVMRGEETQAVGAGLDRVRVLLMPGSHSKWLRVGAGRIGGLRTAMTGEVFAALAAHTILADTIAGEDGDMAGFDDGLAAALRLARPGALLDALFSIRARVLCGTLDAGAARGFLSGLLIGAEVASAPEHGPVEIVATPALARHYALALATPGRDATIAPGDCAARGLWTIARAAGLVTGDDRC